MSETDESNKVKPDEPTIEDEEEVPPPGEGLSEEIFEVDKILNHSYQDDEELIFLVRWKGYGPDDDSWEPADNLGTAAKAIQAYWDANKEKKTKTGGSKKKSKSSSKPPKEKTPKEKTPKETKPKASSSRRSRAKEASDDEEHDSDFKAKDEDEEDEEYQSRSKGSKPKIQTKASVRAVTSAPSALMQNLKETVQRRSGWLYDDDSDDDDEEAPKTAEPVAKKVSKDSLKIKVKIDPPPVAEVAPVSPSNDNAHSSKRSKRGSDKKDDPVVPVKKTRMASVETDPGVTESGFAVKAVAKVNGQIQVVMSKPADSNDLNKLTLREAYEKDGWALVQFLIDRSEFC